MLHSKFQSWGRLKVQRKVELILFCILAPLTCALSIHVYLITTLLSSQESRHDIVLMRERVGELRRLAIDIEDAFRGFLLTQRSEFLAPLHRAEAQLDTEIKRTSELIQNSSIQVAEFRSIDDQLRKFLASKQELVIKIETGHLKDVLEYVRTGQGLRVSEAMRAQFRQLEDQLDARINRSSMTASGISLQALKGLVAAVVGTLILGWLGALILTRSVTEPIALLRNATLTMGAGSDHQWTAEPVVGGSRSDEIGELARAYEEMADRIRRHNHELEVLQTIGHEINSIGPDGLDGVLRRIVDRAVELIGGDVCLVLLRNEQMGCWIVEAASGVWNDRLQKSVMLWEELPVSAQAFETKRPAMGEHLRSDRHPEILRRNLLGNSMLAVPLLSQGDPFGVLALLSEKSIRPAEWNQRLGFGLAQEAAMAISNARLYQVVQEKHEGLRSRVRQLEHLAETMAHDLKGPGQRMAELASMLHHEYGSKLDERGGRWLALLEQNGHEITDRTESILAVARVGARHTAVTVVDPISVINDVLKSRAGELEWVGAHVHVESNLPLIACHSAYLRQVFDNLISNAIKFTRREAGPEIHIAADQEGQMVCFRITDNGIGIAPEFRERVFDAFVRIDQTRAHGSGIGLTIVRRIVHLYGGTVWIEGREESGSVIKFTIPIVEDWADQPASPAPI